MSSYSRQERCLSKRKEGNYSLPDYLAVKRYDIPVTTKKRCASAHHTRPAFYVHNFGSAPTNQFTNASSSLESRQILRLYMYEEHKKEKMMQVNLNEQQKQIEHMKELKIKQEVSLNRTLKQKIEEMEADMEQMKQENKTLRLNIQQMETDMHQANKEIEIPTLRSQQIKEKMKKTQEDLREQCTILDSEIKYLVQELEDKAFLRKSEQEINSHITANEHNTKLMKETKERLSSSNKEIEQDRQQLQGALLKTFQLTEQLKEQCEHLMAENEILIKDNTRLHEYNKNIRNDRTRVIAEGKTRERAFAREIEKRRLEEHKIKGKKESKINTEQLRKLKESLRLETDGNMRSDEQDSFYQTVKMTDASVQADCQTKEAGIQHNWVDLKTHNIQGVTVFKSKYFYANGEQAHSLVWEGFGFELHLPKNTFLPKEGCCIKVDAVCAGDFVIPEGVEPVSAIYIISATTKLRQQSLLRIQHCVNLTRTDQSCQLSFYRATFMEKLPPYHFQHIPGGNFDPVDKYGELELPAFCAVVIGKNSKNSQSAPTEHDQNKRTTGEKQNTNISNSDDVSIHNDDSIMLRGKLFYKIEDLNEWGCLFVVAKNLDAFSRYMEGNLKDYEKGAHIDMSCTSNTIELEITETTVTGWNIIQHIDPCILPVARAKSFGYKKEDAEPPSCLLTVCGDASIPKCEKRFHYPIQLIGCFVGDNQDVKIIINRKLMTGQSKAVSSSIDPEQTTKKDQKIDYYEIFKMHCNNPPDLVNNPSSLATSLRAASLISKELANNVLSMKAMSDSDKATYLFKEVENILRALKEDPTQQRQSMKKFCCVLVKQECPLLSILASKLQNDSGIRLDDKNSV